MYFVYIVECEDGKLYTGITADINRRLKEHRHQGSHFTSYNHSVKLLFKEPCRNKREAAGREKQIKGWARAKKLALAQGDLALLKRL